MNKRTSTLAGLLLAGTLLGPVSGGAHEFWIDASDLRPEPGTEITVHARGGHYFPASALAVADRLIHRFSAATSSGSRDLASLPDKRERVARLAVSEPVLHRIELVLQRPQLDKPDAWARLLLVPTGAASDPSDYATGEGLEILPMASIESARVDVPLPLRATRDGVPLRARIQVVAAEGGVTWIDAAPEQPAAFTPRKAGRHLAMLTEDGQTASLVFDVQP